MNKLKNKNGITLVALIITIIVLLILAMVSISLVMNGGINDKADNSVKTYSNEEIAEQLKLAYSEYQMSQYTGETRTAKDFITERLQETFGDKLDANSVKVEDGKVTAKINGKTYNYNASTGIAEQFDDPFNYGTKTKETVVAGDIISLKKGSIDEKFTIVSNKNGVIVAMPHYNLISVDGVVKQANAENASSAIVTNFSSSNYWAQTENWNANPVDDRAVDINMKEKNTNGTYKNNIQQYIDAYSETLKNNGIKIKAVRACTYKEILDLNDLNNETYYNIVNASGAGVYYLGSVSSRVNNCVWRILSDGTAHAQRYEYPAGTGIRPVIEI